MRSTHTFVELEVPPLVYLTIRQLLVDAGYTHTLIDEGEDERIDMHGIGLKSSAALAPAVLQRQQMRPFFTDEKVAHIFEVPIEETAHARKIEKGEFNR